MINAEIQEKKSLSPVSQKWYLNHEWTHHLKYMNVLHIIS